MTEPDLNSTLAREEDQTFDRTRDIHSNPDSAGRTIAAFATEKGGTILFGQNDNREEAGIDILKQDFITRLSQLSDCLRPPPSLDGPIFFEKDGKTFATVKVIPLGAAGPCFFKGIPYKRQGDQNVQMTPDELNRRWKQYGKMHFEQRGTGATLDQIDPETLRYYLELVRQKRDSFPDAKAFMEAYHLTDADGKHLTSLGMLALARDPTTVIPAAKVILVRFQGTTPVQRIASAELSRPLFPLVKDCENFFQLNLPVVEKFEGLTRKEETAIPLRVIRESLLNFLAHRDYEGLQETVVRIFDDRVEFINPSMTTSEELQQILKTGVPVHRNPLLYNIIRLLGLGEGAGQGIPIIKQLMLEGGLPEPTFDVIGSNFMLVLKYKQREYSQFERELSIVYEWLRRQRLLSSTQIMTGLHTNRPHALQLLNELVRRKKATHKGNTRNSKYYYLEPIPIL